MAGVLSNTKTLGDGAVNGRAERVGSLREDTLAHLETALKKLWKAYRKDLKRCQKKFSEKGVHDSRVQTRRLLSMVGLLEPFLAPRRAKEAEAALQRHLDAFDDLRDTQVQLATLRGLPSGGTPAAEFREHLKKREARFTRSSRKKIKVIKTRRLRKLIACCRQDVRAWLETGSGARANQRLLRCVDDAFKRTCRLRDRIKPQDTSSIHRTRVAFKKFRYMVETLAGDLPFASDKFLDSMHRYQTLMGNIQDAEVLLRAYDKFVAKRKIEPKNAPWFRTELRRRRDGFIRAYLRQARALLGFWPKDALSIKSENGARSPLGSLTPRSTAALPAAVTEEQPRSAKGLENS